MAADTALRDLSQVLRQHAATRPDQVALVFEGRRTTYGQLDHHASQVANGLLAVRPTPQARIGLLDKNSDAFYEIYFGAARARAVTVPVNWRLAPAEIAYILNDAGTEVLFVGEEYLATVEQLLPDLTSVRQVIALAGAHQAWEGYAAWRDRQSGRHPNTPTLPDDVVVQQYTSGTTGHPKGVQLTHANHIACLATAIATWSPCTSDDVGLAPMPQFHVGGSLWGLVPLYAGARCVITRQADPAEILRLIPVERITHTFVVPATLLFMLQVPGCRQTDFSSLKRIVYGASPCPLDLIRDAMATFQCDFVQLYGLTETTGPVTALPPEDHDPDGSPRMRSCGRPIAGSEIRVVGDDGAALPAGEVGEIVVSSPQVMKGYWIRDVTSITVSPDGWFHTGDAGYFDEDGYLYIYDRVKDMIISGAENVYPAEVESALFGHPAVADVGVIGVPDDRWGEAVKAVVVLKPGSEASEAVLIEYCRERIAHYKAPKSIDFVASLPRNPSGKILKRELRVPYWEGRERQVN
ncbi:MAG: fatty acid--CoA ligase [Chloroflexota bacterium]